MTGRDHLNDVRRLRALAGRPELPIHKRLAAVRAGIERLETASRAWTAFAPGRAAVDEVTAQADAVARALRELRTALVAEVWGGANDAA
jgi:hypothetical protein